MNMKKMILSFAVLVLISFSVNAQVSSTSDQKKPTAEEQRKLDERQKQAEKQKQKQAQSNAQSKGQPDNPNAPVVEFVKLVHDYGEIEQHGNGKCEFKFTNTGKEPLILSNVRSSCGCTVPEWPRQPILPGQSDVIKVKYDTKRIGTINKSVHVYSNAKVSPISLKIKGKINAKSQSQLPEKKLDETASPVNK